MKIWKRKEVKSLLISVFAIFLFMNFIQARTLICADNPTQLWHFEEGTGINAEDSCYGYNATLYGDLNWTNGEYGKALKFNGINTYLDAGNIYPFNQNMPEFSFSLWINISNQIAYQSIFRSGYYDSPTEFLELLQLNTGDADYITFMASDSQGIKIVDDGLWHNIIGTFNGNLQISQLYIDGVFIKNYSTGYSEITATTSPLYFGFNFDNGFLMNGDLDEVAFFNRTLSPEEVYDFYSSNVTNLSAVLFVNSYPYVDFNVSYPIRVYLYNNGNLTNLSSLYIDFSFNGINYTFPFTWNDLENNYNLSFTFTQIGDYLFNIYSLSPHYPITNISGTFLVRAPFYITLKGYKLKGNSSLFFTNKYINNFAYITAEFTNGNSPYNNYNPTLEKFIAPLNSIPNKFKKSVFYAPYSDGEAILKLYESNQNYVFRLIDGQIFFPSSYSVPNITKSYGTNVYLGKFTLNGTNQDFSIYLSPSDLKPFGYLFNWIAIIIIGLTLVVGVFLLFVMPQYPSFVLITSIIIIGGTIVLRIILWFLYQ